MRDTIYYPGDPFFCVHCNKCGRDWWSTRRVNDLCSKCGSTDVVTSAPEHTIGKEDEKRTEEWL